MDVRIMGPRAGPGAGGFPPTEKPSRRACQNLVNVARPRDAIPLLISLLSEPDVPLATIALKCVANVSVHPKLREQLREDEACLGAIEALCGGDDVLVARHARVAKDAVLWEP